MIISRCLLKRDHNEFVNEWAKKRAKAMFASEGGEETDDEDGTGIDMNKTISEEIKKGSLDEKKEFLVEFLKTKLIELGSKQASARTLGEDKSPERNPRKSVRFKRGDKIFRLLEVGGNDSFSDSDNELSEEFEAILALKDDKKGKGSKKKNKFPLKKCPLRCEKKEHSNGSLFFCATFFFFNG